MNYSDYARQHTPRARALRNGERMPYIDPADYPTEIKPDSVRGVYGDGNPWVAYLLEYAPELTQQRIPEFKRSVGADKPGPKCRLKRARKKIR